MNIDFNNVRKQACIAYDKLAEKLNSLCDADLAPTTIFMYASEIQEEMDDLRSLIGAIACTFEPGDEKFKEVFSELYPDDQCMVEFNPEEEA